MAIRAVEAMIEDGIEPRTSKPGVWYVRIKPFNKRTGNLIRSLTLSRWGHRIRANRGWHELKTTGHEELAALIDAKNAGDERYAAAALDVCTWEESLLVKKREAEEASRQREVSADPEHAHVLRSNDLPTTRRGRSETRRDMQARLRDDAENDAEARAIRKEHRQNEIAAQTEAERAAARERAEISKLEAEDALAELDRISAGEPTPPKPKSRGKGKGKSKKAAAPPEVTAALAELDAEDDALLAATDTAPVAAPAEQEATG